MHDLSTSYVTELRVHATVCGVNGLMPNTVLAWPDGQDGDAVHWSIDQMVRSAPYGVLDSSLRSQAELLLSSSARRLGPPVLGVATRGRLDTGDPLEEEVSTSLIDNEDE